MKRIYKIFAMVLLSLILVSCGDQISLTFVYDDGVTADKVIEIDKGGTFDIPADPVKDGYTFIGWTVNDEIVDLKTHKFEKSSKIVAKWKKIGELVSVYFVDDDGSPLRESVKVNQGNKVAEPEAPSKFGYLFAGWYLNNKKFDFNTNIEANTTLTAKWEELVSDLTQEELYTAVEDLEFNIAKDKNLMATAFVDLNFKFNHQSESLDGENNEFDFEIDLLGNVFFYLDLNNYENLNLQAEGDLEINLKGNINDINVNFDGTVSIKAFIFKGNLYYDIKLNVFGLDLNIKQKVENLFLEMFYTEILLLIQEVNNEELNFTELLDDILYDLEYADLFVNKTNNDILVQIPIGTLLEGEFEDSIYEHDDGVYYHKQESKIHKADFSNSFIFAEFEDLIKRVGANLEFDFDIENIDEWEEREIENLGQTLRTRFTGKGKVNFEFSLNADKPLNVVEEKDLKGYQDFNELKNIINFILYEDIFESTLIPELDDSISDSNLVIDRSNRILLDLDESAILEKFDDFKIDLSLDKRKRIQADFDFIIKNFYEERYEYEGIESYHNISGGDIKLKGSLDLYLDLTSYEDLYIYALIDLDFIILAKDADLVMPIAGSALLNLYLFDSDLYIDLKLEVYGQTIKLQVKLPNTITEEIYNNLAVDGFNSIEGLEILDELTELVEMLFTEIPFENFDFYSSLKAFDIELPLNNIRDFIVDDEFFDKFELNDSYLLARFSNKLEFIAGSIDLDILEKNEYLEETEWRNYYYRDETALKGRLDFKIELDIPKLPNLKTANDFKNFHTTDEDFVQNFIALAIETYTMFIENQNQSYADAVLAQLYNVLYAEAVYEEFVIEDFSGNELRVSVYQGSLILIADEGFNINEAINYYYGFYVEGEFEIIGDSLVFFAYNGTVAEKFIYIYFPEY